MKKIFIQSLSVMLLSSIGFAGGDIAPIVVPTLEPTEDVEKDYLYVGASLIYHKTYATDTKWFDDKILTQDQTGGIGGLIGYNYNDYMAIEGRVYKSFFDEDYANILNYAIFIKPQYKFIDEERDSSEDGYLSVYALLGYGLTKVTGTDGKTPGHKDQTITDDGGFQWGLGLSYTFGDEDEDDEEHNRDGDITIFAEYNSFMKDRDIYSRLYQYDPIYYEKLSQDAINAGMTYRY